MPTSPALPTVPTEAEKAAGLPKAFNPDTDTPVTQKQREEKSAAQADVINGEREAPPATQTVEVQANVVKPAKKDGEGNSELLEKLARHIAGGERKVAADLLREKTKPGSKEWDEAIERFPILREILERQ